VEDRGESLIEMDVEIQQLCFHHGKTTRDRSESLAVRGARRSARRPVFSVNNLLHATWLMPQQQSNGMRSRGSHNPMIDQLGSNHRLLRLFVHISE
jgi:hypothetical protein